MPAYDSTVPHAMAVSLNIERAAYGKLVLPRADAIALQFFETDISSHDPEHPSYDERSVSARTMRYDETDTTAIRRGMRLNRAPGTLWQWVRSDAPVELLEALPANLDLIDGNDDRLARVQDAYATALQGFIAERSGAWRRLAVATKIMHLKRPRLVPILDRNVLTALGLRLSEDAPQRVQISVGLEAARLLRNAGIANRDKLASIERILIDKGLPRPPARILDALLWLTS